MPRLFVAFLFDFCRMNFICFNGKMLAEEALFTAQNRGFRYGDGVFETIKVFKGKMLLEEYHFDRLFSGLAILKMEVQPGIDRVSLKQYVLALCLLNECIDLARVRLAFYRNEGGLASFVIEASALDKNINALNKEGWTITIYPEARKSADIFSNLKSANYLPYVMADLYAKEMGCNEAIVLNTANNLCDASKANIFLVINDDVYTPALHQGCVDGVKRRFVIEELQKEGIMVRQERVDEKMLLGAQEVFLTNAINEIRWVRSFESTTYSSSFTAQFYKSKVATIYL